MAFEFTQAQGKSIYYAELPAASDRLRVMLLKTVEADATLQDRTTMSSLLTANTEANFTNYGRLTLAGVTVTRDFTNQQVSVTYTSPLTWTNAGGATNNTLAAIIFYYDPDSTDTMANCIPLWKDEFVTTTTGVTMNYVMPTGGTFVAS